MGTRCRRHRQLATLALAVAMAAPGSGLMGLGGATASGQQVPIVLNDAAQREQFDKQIVLAAQQTLTPQQQLKQGTDQYKAKEYEDALATLQAVDPNALNERDRRSLGDALKKAETAAGQRRAARAEFEQGQADLSANKPG